MKPLTERQQEVLDYISSFIEDKGYSPCYREIRDHFEWSSDVAVEGHVRALQAKGRLAVTPNVSRSFRVCA